jgi:hypothetical protein
MTPLVGMAGRMNWVRFVEQHYAVLTTAKILVL